MNWNPEGLKGFDFEVTAKSSAWQEHPELGPEAGREFGKLCIQVYEKGKSPEHEIRRALQRWPDQPAFHLLAAEIADAEQHERILHEMVQDFPDSIYGRLALALLAIKAHLRNPALPLPAALPDIEALHPGRKAFPAMEVYLYGLAAHLLLYFRDEDGEAGRRIGKVLNMAQKQTSSKMFAEIIHLCSHYRLASEMAKERRKYDIWSAHYLPQFERDKVPALLAIQSCKASALSLLPTQELWNRECKYDKDFLDRLLACDREALIQDLCTILDDGIRLYEFSWVTIRYGEAPLHAILLLCHLRAYEAAPTLMKFLGTFTLTMSYYTGDMLTEDMRSWISLLLLEDIRLFDALIMQRDADLFARCLPLNALTVICNNRPELCPAIEDYALDLLRRINDLPQVDADPNQAGMNAKLTDLAIDGHLQGLLDALKPYHEADLVDLSVNGTWEHVLRAFSEPTSSNRFRIPGSIEEMYRFFGR